MLSEKSTPESGSRNAPWLRGAVTSGVGVVIGAISLALFCYALGLNFSDEGWTDGHDPWRSRPIALVSSLIGMAISILLFWAGFFQTTHAQKR